MDESASQVMVDKANPDQLKQLVLSLMEGRKKPRGPCQSPAKSWSEGLRKSSSAELPPQSKPAPEQEDSHNKQEEGSPTTRKFQQDLEAAVDAQEDGNEEEEEGQVQEDEQCEGYDYPERSPYANANATSHRKEWMTMDRRMQAADAKAKWPEFHKLWEAGRDASCCKVCGVS